MGPISDLSLTETQRTPATAAWLSREIERALARNDSAIGVMGWLLGASDLPVARQYEIIDELVARGAGLPR